MACGSRKTAVTTPAPPAGKPEIATADTFSPVVNMKAQTPEVPKPAAPVPTTLTWLDFQAGYEKAVAENKILLVDAYTDWCYWCKVMDRETFSDTAVIRLLNTHFVTVKFNPEKNGKFSFNDTTMDNAQLYRWLGYGNIYGFPTTYFWIRPGKSEERHSLAGYNEPKEFIGILDKVIAKKGGK